MSLVVVVEGDTDFPVMRKLAREAGLEISAEIDCAGKGQLDAEWPSYNKAAKGSPWLVVRDLDHDAACAPEFLLQRKIAPSRWMCFRLSVRELESWLLADRAGISRFLAVPESRIPADPDGEDDPTRTIVNLARQSKREAVRRAMVPKPGTGTAVGPLYEAKIIEFGQRHWNLARASRRSESLRRAQQGLQDLAGRWTAYVDGGGAG